MVPELNRYHAQINYSKMKAIRKVMKKSVAIYLKEMDKVYNLSMANLQVSHVSYF
ncbi:unnamed protein product [Brugia timori]|uniref:Transposase n=1 Tax=Brugia timori TaxID=42155 RepID=A0A0R3QCI3_9BILA|nr:unnamed protein product [Brugia timori]